MTPPLAAHERPVVFRCGADRLLGMLHMPDAVADAGVLVVVGGPQYRVGSHRQFVLMSRGLARAGIPVFRFDGRGMGDSEGEFRGYDRIDPIDEELRAAIDAFQAQVPGLRRVVLWGICGSSCVNLFYGHRDPRVTALALVNPWVRTRAGAARARLLHYYPQRLLQPRFWRDLLLGRIRIAAAAASFLTMLQRTLSASFGRQQAAAPGGGGGGGAAAAEALNPHLLEQMLDGLNRFRGPILFMLSGDDLTAHEFEDLVARTPAWRRATKSPRITMRRIAGADHTFSSHARHATAIEQLCDWVLHLEPRANPTGRRPELAATQPAAANGGAVPWTTRRGHS